MKGPCTECEGTGKQGDSGPCPECDETGLQDIVIGYVPTGQDRFREDDKERIAELEAALKPFVASYKMMRELSYSDQDINDILLGSDLTVDHLRAAEHADADVARKALSQ